MNKITNLSQEEPEKKKKYSHPGNGIYALASRVEGGLALAAPKQGQTLTSNKIASSSLGGEASMSMKVWGAFPQDGSAGITN